MGQKEQTGHPKRVGEKALRQEEVMMVLKVIVFVSVFFVTYSKYKKAVVKRKLPTLYSTAVSNITGNMTHCA